MKTTSYFQEQVLRKRPYLKIEWLEKVLANPLFEETQADGRIRIWGTLAEAENRAVRIVLLADRETVHNAFFDRNFKLEGKKK